MECFLLLKNFLKNLSKTTKLEVKFEFKDFQEKVIPYELKQNLDILRECLAKICENISSEPKKNNENQCKICRKRFSCQEILEFHTKIVHKEEIVLEISKNSIFYCCVHCYKCYKSKFEIHDNCLSKSYFPENLLKLHNKFSCGYCSQIFKNFQRMKNHLNQCKPPECQICNTSFKTQILLISHLKTFHNIENPYQCQLCIAKFKFKSSLQKHLAKNHEISTSQTFQCDMCPKKFIKQIYLTNHKCLFHNLTKKFMCSICGKQFLTENTLRSHTKNHENPIKLECQVCQKVFHRKDKVKLFKY